MTPAERFIERLDKVRKSGPDSWTACCPAHDDLSPSLTVKELPDTRLLIYCFAGCGANDIVASVGLELTDLFPPDDNYSPEKIRKAEKTEAEWVMVLAQDMAEKGKPFSEKDKKTVFDAMKKLGIK